MQLLPNILKVTCQACEKKMTKHTQGRAQVAVSLDNLHFHDKPKRWREQ